MTLETLTGYQLSAQQRPLSDLEILLEREKQLLATPMIVPELLQEFSF